MEEGVPLIAVAVPSAELVDAREGCGAHACAEIRVVGELLQAIGEGDGVATGNDEAFDAVGEEVFGSGGGGGNDGASAGQGLAQDEGEALFDASEREDVAARHESGQFGLGDRSSKSYILGGEDGEHGAEVVLHGADEGEVYARMAQAGKGLEQVRDSFAQTDLAGKEDFEGI